MSRVRMRYPAQALDELRREDPKTPVTLHFIRSLVKSGKIPSIRIGRGYLLNYDMLVDYLENVAASVQPEVPAGIRRVEE